MFLTTYFVELLKYGQVENQYTIQATNLEDAKRKVRALLKPGQQARIEFKHYVMGEMR